MCLLTNSHARWSFVRLTTFADADIDPLEHYMSKFWLADHVHLCLCGGQLIVLDLQYNKYNRIDGADASPMAKVVHGWPVIDAARVSEPVAMDDEPLRELLERRCLTTDRKRGKKALPFSFQLPSQMLLFDSAVPESQWKTRSPIRTRYVTAFAAAVISSWIQLHCLSTASTVSAVARRKARQAPVGAEFDLHTAREFVWISQQLRPFFYTARDACMFDSLVLVNFLARFGLFPNWVFGVQDTPFRAHCWVQAERAVFNDTTLHVAEFTPIMAV